MSYDLYHPSTAICRTYSRQFFVKALELGRLYGWEPMGTCLPSMYWNEWLGTYLTNDGQIVKAEDARSLAAALERSLGDIPDTNPRVNWDPRSWAEEELPEWLTLEEMEIIEDGLQDGLLDVLGVTPLEYFAGDVKVDLTKFIRFCRLGSFEIS
ncbi:MAG TPA: hypothetical protein VJ785_06140 [Anaerolineales bacterium]|nr:hypothetical protein [Anaerolineales bacterium]